ncbi:hypothetical protein LINGRAHAP2_LOCUS30566, partial [Linum grandiflorum]
IFRQRSNTLKPAALAFGCQRIRELPIDSVLSTSKSQNPKS